MKTLIFSSFIAVGFFVFLFSKTVQTEISFRGFCIQGLVMDKIQETEIEEGFTFSDLTRRTEPPKREVYELVILSGGENILGIQCFGKKYHVPVSREDFYTYKLGQKIKYYWRGGFYDFFR